MAHEFIPHEEEPEPQGSGSRLGGPPHKRTAAGVLDLPFPPKKPPEQIPAVPRSTLIRLFVVLILLGLAAVALMTVWKVR